MSRHSNRKRGSALVYLMIVLTALTGFCSLAVDWGRVQVVKAELQLAADAAARYSVTGLTTGVSETQKRAVAAAAGNKADGSPVVLDANADVEFGRWDAQTRAFTVLTGAARSSADAIRITARRTADRGNAVPLMFARIFGVNSSNALATSIARRVSLQPSGYVGLSEARMFDNTRLDSYSAAAGPYSVASSTSAVSILSNNRLTLENNALVQGDAHWGPSGTYTRGPGVVVTGSFNQLSDPLAFPAVSAGSIATSNDNSNIPAYFDGTDLDVPAGASVTLPGGKYYVREFKVDNSAVVTFTLPSTMYLYGEAEIAGEVKHAARLPSNLMIYFTATGEDMKIEGAGKLYATVYNPNGKVHHHGSGQSFGSVIARLLCFRNNGQGHFDTSLGNGQGTGGELIYTVK